MLLLSFASSSRRPPPPPEDPAGLEPEHEDEEPSVGEEAGAAALATIPWVLSVLFHLALVIVALFVVWSAIVQQDEEKEIIPTIRLSETPGAPPTVQPTERETRTTTARRTVSQTPRENPTTSMTQAVAINTNLIGAMGSPSGASAPVGTSVGTGANFKASFFGTGGNAKRIIFLIDASGSLIDTLPFVLVELKEKIQQLSDQQQYTILFFTGQGPLEVPPAGMKKGSADNKARTIEWISQAGFNIPVGGRTDPIPALKKALAYRPEMIFLLSDNITGSGRYEIDQSNLLNEIERANRDKTQINTIQFLYPDPLAAQGRQGTLEKIASQTGGQYKFVDAKELGIE